MHHKPENLEDYIVEELKNIQKVKPEDAHSNAIYQFPKRFLTTEDFEAVFDSYDVLAI